MKQRHSTKLDEKKRDMPPCKDFLSKKEGIEMMTLHPRTVSQGYSGHADWDMIKKLKQSESAFTLYIILAGIFISSLVTCNLIFQKFFTYTFLGYETKLSVGLLAYPITFLVTDIISEIFGKKKHNKLF